MTLPSTTGLATSLNTSTYLTNGPKTLSKAKECVPAISLVCLSPPHYSNKAQLKGHTVTEMLVSS
mgnify:CR=1 FL=1